LQAISQTDSGDSELLEIAVEAARAGASVIRDAAPRRESLVWESKGRSDFVSEVDKASEREINGIIGRRLPGATMLGEELSPTAISSRGVVVIADPLDGTTNFLHGYPEYSVSIAIARDGILCAGVVLNVPREDEFTAKRGGGAFLNGKRIHVSTLREPGRSLIGTGFPFKSLEKLPEYLQQFSLVMRGTAGIRRAGSGGARPVERCVREIRCILGARPRSVGCSGRIADRAGGRRYRHRSGRKSAAAYG
jgi:myo-inositol-1(or 4)-monophosphatase